MILQHKAMATSNSGGFLWTEEKSSIILDIKEAGSSNPFARPNLADITQTLKKRANHNRLDLLNTKEAGCCLCATNSTQQELA